jgi:hypothetical protein
VPFKTSWILQLAEHPSYASFQFTFGRFHIGTKQEGWSVNEYIVDADRSGADGSIRNPYSVSIRPKLEESVSDPPPRDQEMEPGAEAGPSRTRVAPKRAKKRVRKTVVAELPVQRPVRVKRDPQEAVRRQQLLVVNRHATDSTLNHLKQKKMIELLRSTELETLEENKILPPLNGDTLFYPENIRGPKRCVMRAMYALIETADLDREDVLAWIEARCERKTLFDELGNVQAVMNECPVKFYGLMVHVGCHWMALREKYLIDDRCICRVNTMFEETQRAILEHFASIGCTGSLYKQER